MFDSAQRNIHYLRLSVTDLCRETAEPIFLTKNGEGDLVVMDIETYNRREKMLKLREELLSVEEDRMRGSEGYSVDEVTSMMRSAIKDAAVQCGADALHDVLELVPGRDALEHFGAQGVEADVHAVKAGRQQGGQLLRQQDAVCGHGDFADAGDGFQPRHQLVYAFAHQRFAAGDADGVDAAPGSRGIQTA